MNIFEHNESILGKAEAGHLKRTMEDFLQTAHAIRTQLGKQAYLLDKYLYDLLNAINEKLAYDAASQGFEADSELRHLCKEVMGQDEKSREHPFYPVVKTFVEEHPLAFQEKTTNLNYYLVHLFDDFLTYAALSFFDELKDSVRSHIDLVYSTDLYRKISAIIGGEEQMEKLNLLIRQRFMITTAMAVFFQGLTNGLLYALTDRDLETNKPILQIVLEEME